MTTTQVFINKLAFISQRLNSDKSSKDLFDHPKEFKEWNQEIEDYAILCHKETLLILEKLTICKDITGIIIQYLYTQDKERNVGGNPLLMFMMIEPEALLYNSDILCPFAKRALEPIALSIENSLVWNHGVECLPLSLLILEQSKKQNDHPHLTPIRQEVLQLALGLLQQEELFPQLEQPLK